MFMMRKKIDSTLLATVIILFMGLTCLACSSQKYTLFGEGYEIKEVELQGVKRFSKDQLLKFLYAGESSWMPFSPDYPYDEALAKVDGRRIEELYKSYGYYQAEVTGIEAIVDHEDREVVLKISVEEGNPVITESVEIFWSHMEDDERSESEQDSITEGYPDSAAREQVESVCSIIKGDPFELSRLNDSLGNMRMVLLQFGYPLAKVVSNSKVKESKFAAEVDFFVDPGPYAVIGDIQFTGLVHVPKYMLDNEVEFALNAPYSPARVRQIEQALRAMRIFRWVAAQPPEHVEDGKVTLEIRLSEADPQNIRLGVQIAIDNIRWQEQARLEYTHTNLFGHLTRFDLSLVGGWAEMPNPWDPQLHGPVVLVEPKFTKKGFLEKHLMWSLTPSFDVNVQEGYQYYSVSNRLSVSRWFAGALQVGLSHNLRRVDFFNVSPDLDQNKSMLGRDYRDPFLLSYLELRAQSYFVNSITKPTDGITMEATYSLAGSFIGSEFDFHRILAAIRGYWKPFSRLQIATRIQTGLIIPYGSNPSSPFNFRLYLGGANTVRGWGSRRLSPRLEECGEDESCSSIPVGGYTMIQANLEMRLLLFSDFYLVGFFDMGDVQAVDLTYKLDEWNFSAGPGLRYDSPMGLVRLDLGFRLNDPGVYPDEPVWGIYFGLGEAF